MLEKFKSYILRRGLVAQGDRVLLGVSGGVDSMVMLDLFMNAGIEAGVAHCNFCLRGAEADVEQALVENTAAKYGVRCHVARFDTQAEAARRGESIQMAARRLRYDWFESLCREYGYAKVAIAHHGDDSTETFFINLIRGTGLRGMTGISSVNGRIMRPLLFANRDEILAYAAEHGVRYLNDSSNGEIKYLRNRLRHDIIPRLADTSNSFRATMADNIARLESAQHFVDHQMERIRQEAVIDGVIDLDRLSTEGDLHFLLFEILYPYGFTPEVIEDLTLSLDKSGKQFLSADFVAITDRDRVLLTPRERALPQEDSLESDDSRIEWLGVNDFDTLITPTNVVLLAGDAVRFPLRLRLWREGDWFVPLGMKGQKKVSDFLVDAKVSMLDKEKQMVLVSGENTILWLVGRRIDDRYKVTERTARVMRITL